MFPSCHHICFLCCDYLSIIAFFHTAASIPIGIVITPQTAHHPSSDAITELGKFYQKAGPRAGMTREVAEVLQGHLDAAERALEVPEEVPRSRPGGAKETEEEGILRSLLS